MQVFHFVLRGIQHIDSGVTWRGPVLASGSERVCLFTLQQLPLT